MKRLSIVLLLLYNTLPLCASFSKDDRGTAGAKFLKIGIGSRAIAMGEAYTALSDDVFGGYWNPAGLTQIDRLSLAASHNIWLSRFTHDYLSVVCPLARHNQIIAVNSTALTHPGFTHAVTGETIQPADVAIGLSYARSFAAVDAGITVKSITQTLYQESMSGVSADVGLLYRSALDTVGIGLSVLHIGPAIADDRLPLSCRLGGLLRAGKMWNITADIQAPVDDAPNLHLGMEYVITFSDDIKASLRAGFKNSVVEELDPLAAWSTGIGIQWEQCVIDYAFVPYGDLGNTHRMGLSYAFGSRKTDRVRARLDYQKARTLYREEMFSDALDVLEPYRVQPFRGHHAARLVKAAKARIKEELHPDRLYHQAVLFFKEDNFIQSYDLLLEVFRQDPHHERANKLYPVVREKIVEIEKARKMKIQREKNEREKIEFVDSLIEAGKKRMQDGDYQEAVEVLEVAFQYDPQHAEVRKLLDIARENLDKKKQNSSLVEKQGKEIVAQADVRESERLYFKGLDLYAGGKTDLAIQMWKKALKKNPGHAKTINALRRFEKF